MEYQTKYLETFNDSTDIATSKADAIALLTTVKFCSPMQILMEQVISDPDIFEASSLLQLAAIKQLSGESIHSILQLICTGDMKAFAVWEAANKGKLESLGMVAHSIYLLICAGLSAGVVTRKMRLLTLSALCSQSTVVEFSTIATALQVPVDEIESWVIDGSASSVCVVLTAQ